KTLRVRARGPAGASYRLTASAPWAQAGATQAKRAVDSAVVVPNPIRMIFPVCSSRVVRDGKRRREGAGPLTPPKDYFPQVIGASRMMAPSAPVDAVTP